MTFVSRVYWDSLRRSWTYTIFERTAGRHVGHGLWYPTETDAALRAKKAINKRNQGQSKVWRNNSDASLERFERRMGWAKWPLVGPSPKSRITGRSTMVPGCGAVCVAAIRPSARSGTFRRGSRAPNV